MEKKFWQPVLERYAAGLATADDLQRIEQALEAGTLQLTDLPDVAQWEARVAELEMPAPSSSLDERFYHLLAEERRATRKAPAMTTGWWTARWPRLAFATVALLLGWGLGYYMRPSAAVPSGELAILTREVSDLREMMMLTLLEKESATERLKAVSLTQEMSHASRKVTVALLETLNHDDNVNVRLAALDALKAYAREDAVREALVRSIAQQDSPLVQVALAELMVALQEKTSVRELEKILESQSMPQEVKTKIRQSIDVLI